MQTSIMNNMCRCCASEGAFKDIKTTYRWMGEDEVYGDMLKECFNIALSTSDFGEGGICEVCITQLRNAANFKKQVLHTEDQFKKQLQTKFFKPNIVKVELPADDILDSEDNNLSGDDAFSGTEYEIPIKSETVEESKPKKRAAAKAGTSRAKKQKTGDGENAPVKREKQIGYKYRSVAVKIEDKSEHELPSKGELDLQRRNLKVILMCSNATPIRRYSGIGYTCCYCDEQYPEAALLKQHTLSSHTDVFRANFMTNMSIYEFVVKLDITDLCCTICNSNIDTFNHLIDHLTKIHKKTIYTNIKSRIVPIRFNKEILQCDICLCDFNNLKLFLTHMHSHYKNYICKICEAGFISHSALNLHSVIHKVGEFQCDHCTKVFNTYAKKAYHQRNVHTTSIRPYKCGYCLEYFKDYHKKLTHLHEIHGIHPKTYSCHACEKTFTTQKRLTIHTNRDHLLHRPHQCTECDKSFYNVTMLRHHMVKHSGVRNFECGVCTKRFTMKKTLKQHMRIHDNDRRFKCEHCEQAFVQKCSWRGHMRNKHGEDV